MAMQTSQPIKLFYCYAREDHALRDKLAEHLIILNRLGLITTWHDGEIVPGASWEEEIEIHLNTADIILLLISPAFMKSDYCYSKEMERALERHDAKEARVVPILFWIRAAFNHKILFFLKLLYSNRHGQRRSHLHGFAILAFFQTVLQYRLLSTNGPKNNDKECQ